MNQCEMTLNLGATPQNSPLLSEKGSRASGPLASASIRALVFLTAFNRTGKTRRGETMLRITRPAREGTREERAGQQEREGIH